MKALAVSTFLSLALLVSACQSGSQGDAAAPTVSVVHSDGTVRSGSKSDGSSSGGGSFGNESSLTLLHWAADDLAQQILNSSPELYRNLPEGWTQQRLASVIKNVEPTVSDVESYKIPEVTEFGEDLMFWYPARPDGTHFITCTRLFTTAYAAYEVNSRPKEEFYYVIQEIKLKLAHEAAHLMNLGVAPRKQTDISEARTFAKNLLEALDSDNVECVTTGAPPPEIFTPMDGDPILGVHSMDETVAEHNHRKAEFFAKTTQAYVFNRPTGRAAVPSNVRRKCPWVEDPVDHCREIRGTTYDRDSSESIDVFAPRSYSEKFNLKTIKQAIYKGKREYAQPGANYFSWNAVDLRKAILTDQGYRSEYRYEKSPDMNKSFSAYMDFQVVHSSDSDLQLETFPALKQEAWSYYRSQGRAQLNLKFSGGHIAASNLVVLRDFRKFLDAGKLEDINIPVPLSCVRSFKAVEVPRPARIIENRH